MAKAKKKQLPKDFETRLEKCELSELIAIFDSYDVNARGGYSKQSALAFDSCPDELARWLVEHGADIAANDTFGNTPLHTRSSSWRGRIEILLELGANVNLGENSRGTSLHSAAGAYRTATADLLIKHGARVDALNHEKQTPLGYSLQRCSNSQIQNMADLAELLLRAGARKTSEMQEFVARIGGNFEFHRGGFNPDAVEATSAALEKLYALFRVTPVPKRLQYDEKSPIITRSERWEEQYEELWQLLVPSRGAASTVQGEVVRIAGRLRDELERNGGANWDHSYKQMADTFLVHIASETPLTKSLLSEASELVAMLNRSNCDTRRLCELAAIWVSQNPAPVKLSPPDYDR